jgi:hypothetical protein
MLLGRLTSPTQAAQRAEKLLRVQEALNGLGVRPNNAPGGPPPVSPSHEFFG